MSGESERVREKIARLNRDELEFTVGMLRELKQMTLCRADEMLGYLIEMAYIEGCDRMREQAAARRDLIRKVAG